jgi:DUF917 family protein
VEVRLTDLPSLEAGTSLLGSGGGATSHVAFRLTADHWRAGTVVPVLDATDMSPDDTVMAIGVVGAGSLIAERTPNGSEFAQVLARMAAFVGTAPAALLCLEIGGQNGLLIFEAALQTGLPVVDADTMGRALPSLSQLSVSVAGHPLTPLALVTSAGQSVLLEGGDGPSVDRFVRSVLATSEGWASVGFAPIAAKDLGRLAILGSVSQALTLGRRYLSRESWTSASDLAAALGAHVLGVGRVVDVARLSRRSAADFGSVVIAEADGRILRLDMINEYLLALSDGVPVACTPDIIAVIERRGGLPVQCNEVHPGMDVIVLRLEVAEFWRQDDHLSFVSMAAFGLAPTTVGAGGVL